jgi:hypothetical protein
MRGRVPVGKGSNVAVSTLGNSDEVAEANRRPQHRHTPHTHTVDTAYNYNADGSSMNIGGKTPKNYDNATSSSDGGSGNTNDSKDAPAYLVINYIIKT